MRNETPPPPKTRRGLIHSRPFSPFYFARFQAGFVCPQKAAELLGVTVRTVRNWDRRGSPVPVMRLLQLLAGDVAGLYPAWRGFQLRPDGLSGPGKLRIGIEQLREYRRTVELLEVSLAELDQLKRWPVYRFLLRWWPGHVPGKKPR